MDKVDYIPGDKRDHDDEEDDKGKVPAQVRQSCSEKKKKMYVV